jgi:hypothetical protein
MSSKKTHEVHVPIAYISSFTYQVLTLLLFYFIFVKNILLSMLQILFTLNSDLKDSRCRKVYNC